MSYVAVVVRCTDTEIELLVQFDSVAFAIGYMPQDIVRHPQGNVPAQS